MPETRGSSPPGPVHAGEAPPSVRFGAFTLDLRARKLWRGQTPVELPSRSVDVLAYLVAHRDRVAEKDEIVVAAWRDVAVTDDSLIHAISVLRRALGDDPIRPSYIETVPRRGYRFVGTVEAGHEPAQPPPSSESGGPPAPASSAYSVHHVRWMGMAAAVVLLAIVVVAFDRLAGRPSVAEGTVRLQQVAPPGTTIASGGVVSPTGRHLAFVAREEATGRTAVWLRVLDAPEPRRVPGTEDAADPFWSPDGRAIAFFAKGRLVSTDLSGGAVRAIATLNGAAAGGSWGSDGVIVFADWMTGVYAVPASGGPVSRLTQLDHTALDAAHARPQFLPDGRRFLYQVISTDSTRAGVYAASLDTRDSIRLLGRASAATYVPPGFLVYLEQDMLIAEPFDEARLRRGGRAVLLARGVAAPSLADGNVISASRDTLTFREGAAGQQLMWVDRSGLPQGTLEVPTSLFNFRVSPDGQHVLAASSLTDSTGVWLVDLVRRHSTHLAADGIAALWSPDGSQLAFTSRAGLDLYVRPSEGSWHSEPLVSDQSVKVLNDWSPTAQVILYTRHDPATKLDLWQMPLTGGAARPLLNTDVNEAQARLSPDGRWIAYASDSSGSPEVYVRRYPQLDAPRQVSAGGGGQPQWRADRQELFYLSRDRSLMAVTVIDGDDDLSFGAPRRLFRTSIGDGPSGARDSYAAMPDGRSFLIDARRDAALAPITVVLHWAAGLTSAPTGRPAERQATAVARRQSP